MAKTITVDEKRWQAESDARTMAEYEQIMSDSRRRAAATKAAKEMASDLNKRANAMTKVAGGSKSKKK